MSEIISITAAERAPAKPSVADNTAFHEDFLKGLNSEARHRGWTGSSIGTYIRMAVDEIPYVSITIVPGDVFASIVDLRVFRERERTQRDTDLFNN